MTSLEKPLVTVSGQKGLLNSNFYSRILQDLPSEEIEWRRRLDSNAKSVYVDVDFVDFDVHFVQRQEMLEADHVDKIRLSSISDYHSNLSNEKESNLNAATPNQDLNGLNEENLDRGNSINSSTKESESQQISEAFFTATKLLGHPILHTYWTDKSDIENENQKLQFDEWIGKVQASSCTEWAIIVIEDGDLRGHLGTALFKSKLTSTNSVSNVSTSSNTSSIVSMSQMTTSSLLDKIKTGFNSMFHNDSERWLTIINQDRLPDSKAQESYWNFIKKFRNVTLSAFSKQIELLEEKLRIQRDLRNSKAWNFLNYFTMQEELANAFEFLTLFDEALVQYDLLDALFSEFLKNPDITNDHLYKQWISFTSWQTLCLDPNSNVSKELRQRIIDKKASLLDMRNYLFARQCDLMLLQNQPWKVASSALIFLQNCLVEHQTLNIASPPGSLSCWIFTSALEVLARCECYSCTSTMENYSYYTVDTWNYARKKLFELGVICGLLPSSIQDGGKQDGSINCVDTAKLVEELLSGLGPEVINDKKISSDGSLSPRRRLEEALSSRADFAKHYIEISELTLGTYKHIGRKRHALQVGIDLAQFYIAQGSFAKAIPFLLDMETEVRAGKWETLIADIGLYLDICKNKKEA